MNARPARTASRKPLSSTSTAATKPKLNNSTKPEQPAGKRKREAFGELTSQVANNNKANKGKQKEDSKTGTKSKSSLAPRQPLRQVSTTQQSNVSVHVKGTILEEIPEQPDIFETHDDNAMIIDPPLIPAPSQERPLFRRQTRSSRSKPQVDEDLEDGRVFKKRRTSSEPPEDPVAAEEARLQAERARIASRVNDLLDSYVEEPEADPDGDAWQDLDEEDAEDPLMVSEYVGDVFEYYKEIEVRLSTSVYLYNLNFP